MGDILERTDHSRKGLMMNIKEIFCIYIYKHNNTWSVQKVLEQFLYNFFGHNCNSALSPSKYPFCIDALLPAPLPLLEAVLVHVFWVHA
jgi:hypothetical protein